MFDERKVIFTKDYAQLGMLFYMPVIESPNKYSSRTWRIEELLENCFLATPVHMPNTLHRFDYGSKLYTSMQDCDEECNTRMKSGGSKK